MSRWTCSLFFAFSPFTRRRLCRRVAFDSGRGPPGRGLSDSASNIREPSASLLGSDAVVPTAQSLPYFACACQHGSIPTIYCWLVEIRVCRLLHLREHIYLPRLRVQILPGSFWQMGGRIIYLRQYMQARRADQLCVHRRWDHFQFSNVHSLLWDIKMWFWERYEYPDCDAHECHSGSTLVYMAIQCKPCMSMKKNGNWIIFLLRAITGNMEIGLLELTTWEKDEIPGMQRNANAELFCPWFVHGNIFWKLDENWIV